MDASSRTNVLYPTHLISIYQTDSKQSYAEFCEITEKGHISEFRPLTDKDGIELSQLFKDKAATFKYNYNPAVLKFEKSPTSIDLIFRTIPTKRFHIYSPGLKLTNGLRPVPGLIWKYSARNSGSLNMYAYKEFKKAETELFRPPFMNSSLTNVCLGTSQVYLDPSGNFDLNIAMKKVKKGYWESAFSHSTNENQIVGNLHKLSADLLSLESFPESVLVPLEITEKQITRQLLLKDIL